MDESIVNVPKYELKMGEAAASNDVLKVSVSFGRFENDLLSWEKWSSFSPNKYLDEVEKCATPGSVAQKKAYFEAHYKNIAARKAELLVQEMQMENDSLRSEDKKSGDLIESTCEANSLDVSNRQSSAEGINQETILTSEVSSTSIIEPTEDAEITCQSTSDEGVKEEHDSRLDSPKLNKPEEAVLVKEVEEIPCMGSQNKKELQQNLDNEIEDTPKIEVQNVKLDHPKESHKINLVNKERNMAKVKKKLVSPITKAPQFPAPRVSKPAPTTSVTSASLFSTKKGIGSSLPRSKNPCARETPKSLHMSLSLGPSKSDPIAPTRKSFIMEKMGDKDIVKRAFKTFQNSFNQERSSVPKQVPPKKTEPRISPSLTARKENGGSLKAGGEDKRSANVAPSSFGLKSNERVEKWKEFSKKLGEKSNAREAERTRIRSKVKEEKEVEIRKLRQKFNFKARPMPSFYQGQKPSKGPSDKEDSKNVIHQ